MHSQVAHELKRLSAMSAISSLIVQKPARAIKRLLHASVFRPVERGRTMEGVLAVMFHRLSATIYLAYALWAVSTAVNGIPSLIAAKGDEWQTLFSIAVLIAALPACFGATFWPLFARLELFASAVLSSLFAMYIFQLFVGAITEENTWGIVVITATSMIVPLSRLLIVIRFLVLQAEEREAADKLTSVSENQDEGGAS